MLFRMVLFNKFKLIWILILLSLFVIIAFIGHHFVTQKRERGTTQLHYVEKKKVDLLLNKADSTIGIAPDVAEQLASEAFRISQINCQVENIIKSWIKLGKIQKIRGDNKKALNYFSKARILSKEGALLEEYCESIINIGELIYDSGKYDISLKYFQEAVSLSSRKNYDRLLAHSLYYIGKYHHTKGHFQQSKDYYNLALKTCKDHNNLKEQALIYPSIGKYYINEGKLNLALEYYLKAYYISEQLNDNFIKADVCNHLGGLYLQMDQYQKALKYHRQALEYRKRLNNPDGLAKSYNNIGEVFYELKQLDSANLYFTQSLQLCKSIGYKKGFVKAKINLGKVYNMQNKPEKAYGVLKNALTTSYQSGYDAGIAESSLALGCYYQKKSGLDSAIYYYQICLSKLCKTGYDEILRNTYRGLYSCYLLKADYKKALEYHQSLLETEKELLNVENNRQLAILNITFNNEIKEKDNQVLRKDNELKNLQIKRKTIIMWLVILLLCITILLCLNLYNRFYLKKKSSKLLEELNITVTKQNSALKNLNNDLKKANQEKDKLFSIIAHELRNPLYWFQNLAETLSKNYEKMPPDKVRKTISALDESAKNAFHLMDNLLHWSRSKLNRIVPKKAAYHLHTLVLDAAQMYETIIQHKEIVFIVTIPEDVEIFVDPDLFNCVIRNLVSNAIKYTPVGGTIRIESSCLNNSATVIVSDSGSGIPDANVSELFKIENPISMPGLMQEKGSGLGLKLCKDFVEMNAGKIWVISKEHVGTKFIFTIPLYRSSLFINSDGEMTGKMN